MSKIDDIRAREAAATKGPWSSGGQMKGQVWDTSHGVTVCLCPEHVLSDNGVRSNPEADADFIAAAREDIPYLLDLVERAKEFAEKVAPKGPPYTVPAHTMLAPGMRTPIQQRAEQWLLEVRGDGNVPAGKEGGQP